MGLSVTLAIFPLFIAIRKYFGRGVSDKRHLEKLWASIIINGWLKFGVKHPIKNEVKNFM